MNAARVVSLSLLLAYGLACGAAPAEEPARPLYRDASQPIEKRVDDLLGRMTLEEKVGQMNMPCVYESALGKTIPEKTEAVQKFAAGTLLAGLRAGRRLLHAAQHDPPRRPAPAGRVPQPAPDDSPWSRRAWASRCWRREEGTHGLMCPGATVFPEGPALGSTWNMDLLGPRLCRRGQGSPRDRRAPDLHAGRRADPRSAPRPQRRGVQRRPVPLLADRRDHRPLGAGQRRLGPRQGRRRALPLSRPEPAGQRSGARGHGGLRTHAPRGLPALRGRRASSRCGARASWPRIRPSTACRRMPRRSS